MSASSEVFEKYGITTNETSIPRVEGMSASDAVMAKYGIDTSSRDRRRQLREEDDKRREEERKKEEEERRVDQERRDTWMKGYEKEPEGDKPGQAESLINEYMSTVAGGISSAGSSIESTGKVWQMGDTEEEETGEKNVFKERRDKVKDVYTNVAEFFARKIHGDEGFEQKKKEFGEVLEEYGSAIKTTYGEGKIDELELLKGIREDIIAKEDRGVVSDVAHTLAGGIGSMTAGLGASALGGVVGGPTGAFMAGSATMGLQEKGSFVEEAKTALARQRGVEVKDLSDADILNADTGGNIYGAVSGVLESLVPAKSIGRILKGKGEKSLIGAIVKSMALTGLEEGTTEYSQRMAQNIILKVRELDPEIKITEGAWEEAVAGAITGAFTFGLGSGIATGIRKPDDVARELLSDGDTKSAEKEMDGMSIQEMRELKTDMDNMNDSMSSEVVMGKLESRAKEVDTQTKRVIKENNLSVLAESTPQVKADVINNIKEIAPFNEEAQVVLGKIESRENKQAEIETQIESKKKLIGEGGINKKVLEESTEKLVTRLNKSQDLSVYEINDVLEGGNIEDIKELPAETQKTFNREIAKIAETEGPNQETAKNIISKLEMEKEVKFQEKLPEHPLTTSETDLSPTQIKAYKKAEELLVISEQAVDPKIQQASLSEANQIMADNDIKVSTAGFKDKYGIDTKFQEKETPLQQEIKKAKKEGKTAEEFVRQDFQDKVTAGQELGDEINKKVNTDGTITLYHGTSKQALEKISEGGEFNDGAYFSVEKTGTEYGDSPIDVAKRKFGEDGVVMEIKVDARDLESTAGNSEVFSPNKLIKQPDGSWKSEIVKTEKQLINEYNKTEDKFQEKAGEKRITTKEAFKRIAESPLLKGLNIKKVGAIFTPQGAEAWGKYSQGWIEFAENPKDTTLSHESFHAFLDLLVPDSKVQEAFKEIRKRDKKDYTDLQAEEILAEEFAEFFISEKRPTNKLEQFFAYLSRKLKNMINGADVIETLFNEATNPANTAKIKKALRDDRKTKLAGAFQEKEKADITTPAFKKWFGDSKVVDENGDPLVVYHGSSQTFNIFKPSQPSYETEPSMYFTDNLQIADTYYSKYEGKVYNVYLKMENPYVINASGQTYNDFYDEATRAINDAKKDGYDGVRIDDIIDDNQQHGDDFPSATTFVVFNPNQIKSVENIGTFSPTDPDIRYQTKEVTKKGKEVANLTKDLNSVNDSRRAIRQDFIQSADGQELIMRHDASQEFVQDIDPQILQGIRNNPIYKKEGSITDEMADGHLMEKNGRYVISGRTGTQALEMGGYSKVIEVDTLAQDAGFDSSLEFLEDQAQYIDENTLTQEINEELMKNEKYANKTSKAQNIHRDRRKLYKDQESFEIGSQAMKSLQKEVISKIKEAQTKREGKIKQEFKEKGEAIKNKRKEKEEDVEMIKREIIIDAKRILKKFPEEKKALLATIKNAKTLKDIDKARDFMNRLREKAVVRSLKAKIKKELKSTKVKKQSGKPVGKFSPQTQVILDTMQEVMGMTKRDAEQLVVDNISNAKQGLLSEKQSIQNAIIKAYFSKDLNDVSNLLKEVQSIKERGQTAKALKEFNTFAETETRNENIIDTITGGEGLIDDSTAQKKDKLMDKIRKKSLVYFNTMQGFDNILDVISFYDKTTKPHASIINREFDMLAYKNAEKKGTRVAHDKLTKLAMDTFNFKGEKQLLKKFSEDNEQKVLGTFENAKGNMVELEMSTAEARKRYMEMQDPSLKSTLTEGMGYTEEIETSIEDSLSPEDKAFALAQLDFYGEYYKRVNEAYEKMYNVSLPFNEFYSPIKRRDVNGELETGSFLEEQQHRASVTTGSMKSRVGSAKPLGDMSDVTVLQQHIVEMEHFIAFAEMSRKLNSTFNNVEVRKAIKQRFDSSILHSLDRQIEGIIRGGIDKSGNIKKVENFRINFTKSVLAVKPSILIKQLTSSVAYVEKVPTASYVKNSALFWKNPIKNAKELYKLSTLLQERGSNMERDIKDAMNSSEFKAFRKSQTFMNKLMLNVQLGDQGAIVMGGWPVYKHVLDGGKVEGFKIDPNNLESEAVRVFEKITEQTQQSGDITEQSFWQTSGSIAKLFTSFMSSPNQYFRKEVDAIRNLTAGRGSKKQHIKTLAVYHIMLPMIFQSVANAFTNDEDDKEYLWAMLLGSFNGVFIFGQMAEHLIKKATGERTWAMGISLTSMAEDLGDAIGLLADDDITDEDIYDAIKGTAGAVGKYTGTPIKSSMDMIEGALKGNPLQAAGWSAYISDKALNK